jgi:hypothetical protein
MFKYLLLLSMLIPFTAQAADSLCGDHDCEEDVCDRADVLFCDDFNTTNPLEITDHWEPHWCGTANPMYHQGGNCGGLVQGLGVGGTAAVEQVQFPNADYSLAINPINSIMNTKGPVYFRHYIKYATNYDHGVGCGALFKTGYFVTQSDASRIMLGHGPLYRLGGAYLGQPTSRGILGWDYKGHTGPDATYTSSGEPYAGAAAVPLRVGDTVIPIERDTWYSVEIMAHYTSATINTVKLWINGTLTLERNNFNDTYYDGSNFNNIWLDAWNGGGTGCQQNPEIQKQWRDNVVVATNYIGPINAVAPTLSVNLSASITAPCTVPCAGVTLTADPVLEGTGPDYKFEFDCDGNGTYEDTVPVEDDPPAVLSQSTDVGDCDAAYAVAGSYNARVKLTDCGNSGAATCVPVGNPAYGTTTVVVNGSQSSCPSEAPPSAAAITGFQLINATTEAVADASFVSGDTIDVSNIPCPNVQAVGNAYLNVAGAPGSVSVSIDGTAHCENEPPFSSGNDSSNNFNCDTIADNLGPHTVVATPYDAANCNASGGVGTAQTVEFTTVP